MLTNKTARDSLIDGKAAARTRGKPRLVHVFQSFYPFTDSLTIDSSGDFVDQIVVDF